MGSIVVKDTTDIEICILLIVGALSIIYESIFVIDIGGRYSGFYLNPNAAGFACIIGYCMSMSVKYKILQILGQVLFSIAGLLTFSRTFLLIWILINMFSLLISYKNVYKIFAGALLFSFFLSLGDKFDSNVGRLEAFSSIQDGKVSDEMEEGSRTSSWAAYYDKIYDSPLFGNGYLSFSGNNSYSIQGVHNAFLMILGESGIFAFLYFTAIYGGFVVTGIRIFKNEPLIFLVSFSLFTFMLTSHNYFDNYLLLFVSIWLWTKINSKEIIVENKKYNQFQDKREKYFIWADY